MKRRGDLIEHEIPDLVRRYERINGFEVEGSNAMGLPSHVPWVRVFHRATSPSATKGTYAVFLFAAKGTAVFLSLNQGATEREGKNYIPLKRTAILSSSGATRVKLQEQNCELGNLVTGIDLVHRSSTVRNYEAGNIYALRYDANSVPPDATIYADLSRILSLWKVLNPDAKSGPQPGGQSIFQFVAKAPSALSESALVQMVAKKRSMILEHNTMQRALYDLLKLEFGKNHVGCENCTCLGTRIDLVVKQDDKYRFYEIKTDPSPRVCLRQAIGQLLEYAFFGPGRPDQIELIVVGRRRLDKEGTEYLQLLNGRFGLAIKYETVNLG